MKRIVAASCDAKFFPHACDLIAGIRETSSVDEILFFDLGLEPEQRAQMEDLAGVRVVDYPKSLATEVYADFLAPRMFAWKTWILREAANFGEAILYMDCGCAVLHSLQPIFDLIRHDGIFLVQDVHRSSERTHEACFSIMQATAAERAASQIDAGVIGYRADTPFAKIFEEGFEYAKNRDCIFGDASVHRHDQSIYSVLAARHAVPVTHPYGRYLHWQGIQSRDQIIWQHRGKWPAFRRLGERAKTLEPGRRIALYGAGKHTERFLMTLRNLLEPQHRVVGILDDAPKRAEIDGIAVLPTAQWESLAPNIVIASSDAHETEMLQRAYSRFRETKVWGIYEIN